MGRGKRTVVRDVGGAGGCDDAAAEAKGLSVVVDFGPLAGGERRGCLHNGRDGDKGNGRVTAEEVG